MKEVFSLWGLSFVCYVLSLIMVGIWTNRDSKKKNLNNRLWTAITVIIPFCIGFAIYFIANPKSSIVQCPYCSYVVKRKEGVCTSCGAKLVGTLVSPKPDKENKKFVILYLVFSGLTVIFYIVGIVNIFI